MTEPTADRPGVRDPLDVQGSLRRCDTDDCRCGKDGGSRLAMELIGRCRSVWDTYSNPENVPP